ncbi:MAG TPA: DUF2842 domain-containing protein [Asticcacaulis sp.]|nr:DUF2842 domain-containing protein [Asticcacaulis sp.]
MKPELHLKPDPDTLPKGLSLPHRRLVACVGIVVFLVAYVMGVSDIGRHLPDNALVQLLFYALAGTLWGVPVLPLISWSENYKSKPR